MRDNVIKPMPKTYSFTFRIGNDEMKRLLINHLLVSEAITPNEEDAFTGFSHTAGGMCVEFTVPPPKPV